MDNKPQQVTHYADGATSEVREMTDEEIAQLPPPIEDGVSDLAD